MSKYDDFLAAEAGNKYDAALQVEGDQQRQRLRASMFPAVRTNADEYAEAKQLGRETGIPPDVVQRNLGDVRQRAALNKYDQYLNSSPALGRQLQDPDFAKLAHDDTGDLSLMETLVNSFKRGVPALKQQWHALRFINESRGVEKFKEIDRRLALGEDPLAVLGDPKYEGAGGVGYKESAESALSRYRWFRGMALPTHTRGQGEQAAGVARTQAEQQAIPQPAVVGQVMQAETFGDAFGAFRTDPIKFIASIGPQSLVQNAPGLAAAVPAGLAAGPAGAAVTLGAGSFVSDYSSSIVEALASEGVDITDEAKLIEATTNPELMQRVYDRAERHAAVVAAFDTASAGLASKTLLPQMVAKKLASKPAAKGAANIAVQTPVQGALGAAGEAGGQVASGQELKPGEILAEAAGEMFGTPAEVVSMSAESIARRTREAESADQNAAALQQVNEIAKASKTAQRDPESFSKFVEAAAAEGPVQDVYVDANTLAQTLQQSQIDPATLPETVRAQIDEAITANGDVRIPLGDYSAYIAPTDLGNALLPHLRTSPEAMSQAEAQTFMQGQAEEFKKEAEKALAEKQADQAWQESAKAVETELMTQLQQANRFTNDVNTAYATLMRDFYVTTAARLGVTPQEMFARYPLQVRAESVAGDARMDQPPYTNVDSLRATEREDIITMLLEERGANFVKSFTELEGRRPDYEDVRGNLFGMADPVVVPKIRIDPKQVNNTTRSTSDTAVREYQGMLRASEAPAVLVAREGKGYKIVEGGHRLKAAQEAGVADIPAIDVTALLGLDWAAYLRNETLENMPLRSRIASAKDSAYTSDKGGSYGQSNRAVGTAGRTGEVVHGTVAGGNAREGWAESTRIRGKDGQPLAIYRGASIPLKPEHFKLGALGAATGRPSSGLGVWFTINQGEAQSYGNVETFNLDIRNPKVFKVEDLPGFDTVEEAHAWREGLRQQGHDGIIVSAKHLGGRTHIVAFEPEQVVHPEAKAASFWQPAYHGSPHDFDRFSLDKIGTGEGVQAYGWGLYFAENPGIAAGYHDRLAGNPALLELKLGSMRLTERNYFDYSRRAGENDIENVRASLAEDLMIDEMALRGAGNAQEYVLKRLDQRIKEYETEWPGGAEAAKQLRKELARPGAVSAKWRKASGGVYTVDIPDEAVAKMLDWDKPLGEQEPGVQESLKQASLFSEENEDAPVTGADLYTMLTKKWATRDELDFVQAQRRASLELLEAGIPGIKYDDAVSRTQEEGTHNLVIFDDSIVTVTHKDGKPLTKEEREQYLQSLQQEPGKGRGSITFDEEGLNNATVISLLQNADLSTFLHESGHFYLEVLNNIANKPDAPVEIREDMQRLLDWFGVKDMEAWNALDIEGKRPHHEKFARGFEAYLFEGKAPSQELNGLFARFRAWMLNVYRSLTALNVELSDEVRGVMDRMLATNDQIKAAEAARAYAPLFKSAEEAGMTPEEWAAYQEMGAEATQVAVDQLQKRSLRDMQWLTNARGRKLKELQKDAAAKRKEVQREVTDEVRKNPVYAAIRFLTRGELPGHEGMHAKLSLPALKQMYGEAPDALWRRLGEGRYGMTAKEGLHPDQAAEMLGFTSGDHLVREILAAGPERSVIEGMTDQRMLERYGDLSDPAAIERAANEAIHNEARGRFVATELRAINRAMNPRERTAAGGSVNVLTKAAKEYAATIVARKKVRDIRPSQYEAAEARAAKAAEKASDLVEKATQKRNQLINNYATKAAYDAIEEIDSGVRYLRKFDTDAVRKKLDPEYTDQIDKLLERFDLRTGQSLKDIDKRTALAKWITDQEDQGLSPVIDDQLRDEAFRQHYRNLPLEQFRGLVDAVKNIEHLGRLKKKLLTAADKREFDAAVQEMTASIEANATGTVKERRTSDRGPLVAIGKLFRNFMADHRKFASLAREMDGFKDGGAMWEYLVRNMNDAGNHEAVEREKATIHLSKLLKPILKEGQLSKKQFFPIAGKSFTREERLGIALNMGNLVNRERVVSGEKLTPQALDEVLGTLTKDEWDFVQGVWDYFESFRSEIAAKEKRLTGVEPEWVQATPVQTKHGEYKGGYYPIKYDPLRSSRAEADSAAEIQQQMMRGLYTRSQTRRGHLKERVESTGRPLRYDLGVIVEHVDQVIHDLSWHEYLIDANRLLRDGSIDSTIREHYGPEKLRTMKDTLRDTAVGDLAAVSAGESILNHLRHGATIAGLGWNLATSLLQPLGLTQSIVRIGPKYVAKGAKHWLGDIMRFENSAKEIYAKSEFMRLRGKTMQREINEIRNKVKGKDSLIEASYFYMIQKMQLVADIPTWWGAYEKAYTQADITEERAVALADQAVIDAQGAGQIKDLAAVQRGSAMWRLFTNFYSFFNTTFNLTAEATGRTDFKSPASVALLAADLALLYTIPAILGTLLKTALSGDWEDEEKLAKRLIADQLNYLLGTVVVLRELSATVQGSLGLYSDYGGPASVRFFSEITKLGKQIQQGEADGGFWKALNNSAGIVFHYPAGQINRTIGGLDALASGDTENPGVLLVGP